MKYPQIIFKLTLMVSIVSMMLMSASCSENNIKPSDEYEKSVSPSNDYAKAVEKVSSSAKELNIKSYSTPNSQITINKSHPEFEVIIKYLEQSKLTRSQPRFVVQEGKKVQVGIPYAIAFTLEFTLSDGSKVVFDFGTDQFWFNTEEMIYSASVDSGLYEILQQLLKE
jgi:hypothetical protein